MSTLATLPFGATVFELSDSAGGFPPSRGGGPIGNAIQNDAEPFRIYAEDSLRTGNGVTGLTITATLCKAGQSSFSAVSPTYADLGNGWYRVTPIAAHRDTLGESTWRFTATGSIIADRREIVKVNSLDGYFAKLFRWLGVLAGKGSDPATLAEIQATAGGTTFDNATDSLEAVGDAVADEADAIIAVLQGSTVVQVASPNVSGNLVLTQGDTYDGIGNPKAQWNVATDYTDGWAVVLTIRDKDDAVIYSTTGSVDSETLISVAIDAPEGLEMEGCPGQWQGKFDVELTKASSVVTVAIGVCYINEDQTR
jgi:hypothetical protein